MNHSLLRITEATTLAFHTMAYLAALPNKKVSTRQIAKTLNASETHLAKVIQCLAKNNLIHAARGPKGGSGLAQPSNKISLLNIYEAMEGRLAPCNCLLGTPLCVKGGCIFGNLLPHVNSMVTHKLSSIKLSMLKTTFCISKKQKSVLLALKK